MYIDFLLFYVHIYIYEINNNNIFDEFSRLSYYVYIRLLLCVVDMKLKRNVVIVTH